MEIEDHSDGRNSLPLVEKYRPESLDEIISHNDIINTCKIERID